MKLVLNKHQLSTALSLVEDNTTRIAIKQLNDGIYAWRENNPGARLGSIRLNEVQVSEWPFEVPDDGILNESLIPNKTVEEKDSRWAAASPWLD